MKEYYVIGLMSGTSLDGLDIAYIRFWKDKQRWHFQILASETFAYQEEWRLKLKNVEKLTALDYALLDVSLGKWMAETVREFISKYGVEGELKIDFISSHGHTIFHQPELGLTAQIGSGASIAAITKIPVVCDFRKLDVALGGQGAPLVPIGDELLFADYHVCLNLGGIANISATIRGRRIAFDVSPCNMVLNHYAEKLGKAFDMGGEFAKKGNLIPILLKKLNQLPYYQANPPKSLGKEWVMKEIMPLMIESDGNEYDKLHTFTEHIAQQIAHSIKSVSTFPHAKILTTGGGAFNEYLISRLDYYLPDMQIIVPEERIVNFKEALIFGFLGVLRWRGEKNCLNSVTGAPYDHSGGIIWMPSSC
ncbi:MAG: anhydro-N-acetylmuramic acid kinase [Flammeovirgaceae bacterium]